MVRIVTEILRIRVHVQVCYTLTVVSLTLIYVEFLL